MAVATPAETHADIVRECLLAGKDVYVEKPLCLAAEDGRTWLNWPGSVTGCSWGGGGGGRPPSLVPSGGQYPQKPDRSGDLGKILYIYSNRLNLGKLRREENVLWSFAPHDISLILGFLEEMPDQVQAQGGNYLHQGIADVTVSTLRFPSGVRAHLFVSWLHPIKEQKLVVVGRKKWPCSTIRRPGPKN